MSKNALRLITLAVAAAYLPAMAAGLQFSSQSAGSQSTANASGAEAADASTISYNPAGMSYLSGNQFAGTLNLILPSVKVSNAQAKTLSGTQIKGRDSDDIADAAPVPHMYLSSKINDSLALGVGMYVPFGSGTEYERDSVLRYNVNQTSLKTLAINPAMSFKLAPNFSIGFGVVAQHAEGELRQYANFAASLARVYDTQGKAVGATTPTGKALLALAAEAGAEDGSGKLDGFAKVEGDDWGFGLNFGMMWDVTPETRLGFNYRSAVKHELAGEADWTLPSGDLATKLNVNAIVGGTLGYVDSPASIDIKTPSSFSFSLMQKLSKQTNLFVDFTRTKHSTFQVADVMYNTPKLTISTTPTNFTRLTPMWKDASKVSIGMSHQLDDSLQLRAGLARDKTPVPGADYRMTTLPDNDRTWLSMGAKWAWDKNISLDFAYSYINIKDATANVNGWCGGAAPGVVNCVSSYTNGSANFKSHAHLLGMQAVYKF